MEVAVRSSIYVRSSPRILLLLPTLGVLACTQLGPEDRVEQARAQYTVQLTSFAVHDQPQLPPVADEADGAESAAADGTESPAAEAATVQVETPGDVPEEAVAVPTMTSVVLDILVTTEGDERLPGLSVELEQVGTDGTVKMERLLWLDVSQVVRGSGAQVTQVVEDIDYQEGDGFAVSIRSPVPPGERAAYREFQSSEPATAEY
jgi:hypothetical protein